MGYPKRLASSLKTAVIIRWPVSFEVAVEIHPDRIDNGATVGLVALRLIEIGGTFVGWKPDFNGLPAVAQFHFSHPADRDQFIARAVEISGVSIAATRSA